MFSRLSVLNFKRPGQKTVQRQSLPRPHLHRSAQVCPTGGGKEQMCFYEKKPNKITQNVWAKTVYDGNGLVKNNGTERVDSTGRCPFGDVPFRRRITRIFMRIACFRLVAFSSYTNKIHIRIRACVT